MNDAMAEAPPQPVPQEAPPPERRSTTRTRAVWVAVIVGTILGIALIDFIAQNGREVRIEFFGASGRVSLAVALLVAAVAGAAVAVAAGIARLAQLRASSRRKITAARRQAAEPPVRTAALPDSYETRPDEEKRR